MDNAPVVKKPGPTARRRNRERAAAAVAPTPDEAALIAARAELLAAGRPPILEALAGALGLSKPRVFRLRSACVAKGLVPAREAPEYFSERGRAAAAERQEVLRCAREMAEPGTTLDVLALSKRLGWTYQDTLRRVRQLRLFGSWPWKAPPRPRAPRVDPEPANPLERIEPPAAVVAEVEAARDAITRGSPSRRPAERRARRASQPRRSIDFKVCDVDEMVREWKRRKRRARHEGQA